MPYYDPIKDEIIGATPGTLIYYHEVGHQVFRKLGELQVNLFPHILIISIGLLAYGLPWAAKICFWFWVGLSLLNEIAAWIIAFGLKYIVKRV